MFPNLATRWQAAAADPFVAIRREMDQAFEELFPQRTANGSTGYRPAMTLRETDDALLLEIDVPGFRQEDLDVQFHDGMLTISGERRPCEEGGRCWHNERGFGRFERHVRLSDKVDASNVKAELTNGVLSLRIAKKPEAQPVKISVTSPTGQSTESPKLPE